jgi:hypothetical protein
VAFAEKPFDHSSSVSVRSVYISMCASTHVGSERVRSVPPSTYLQIVSGSFQLHRCASLIIFSTAQPSLLRTLCVGSGVAGKSHFRISSNKPKKKYFIFFRHGSQAGFPKITDRRQGYVTDR